MKTKLAKTVAAAIALFAFPAATFAEEAAPPLEPGQTNRGRLTWSAFECATLAEVAGDEAAQRRLFQLGYDTGKAFLEQFVDGATPDEDAMNEMKHAPMGVTWRLGGPSNEFRLGRIYEGAATAAHERISERDNRGFPLNPADYITDPELQATIARTRFLTANCALLR